MTTPFTPDDLVRREVGANLSVLVSTLCAGYGAADLPRDLADLCEQAVELASLPLDYESAAYDAGWREGAGPDGVRFVRPATPQEVEDGDDNGAGFMTADDAEDACLVDGLEPYEREAFEFWSVAPMLADDLETLGEHVVRDFAGFSAVWARTTTGQGIGMDYVIRRVHARIVARGASLHLDA